MTSLAHSFSPSPSNFLHLPLPPRRNTKGENSKLAEKLLTRFEQRATESRTDIQWRVAHVHGADSVSYFR
ncbi:hypothetical protein C0Q70_12489 [Pomacea canaliculata]|uniref:Uncharacterized protein n=1 Tax=Pomacea canaliculata TaxID=400727 RepID=A0A2T7P1Q5_POMCA|nr:hypothetical protein C0Q70_12489 [Pomacea canaliculata]